MKEARMKIYQEEINATIAQHDANVQNIALLNNEIEKQAKSQWQQDCTTIMEENNSIVENIRKDWEAKTKEIKENNALLAMKRIDYQVNLSLSTMLINFVTIYLGLV
jgi:excinuclease UvrABC helicase subunit UvrB